MMTEFDTITTEDRFIKGELADGGVVAISDEEWTEADEDTLEGNWERATRAIVKEIMDTESLGTDIQSGETVSVDRDRFVDALTDSSVVAHDNPQEERRRAELLIEHLVREEVYERRGEEIVVLDEFDYTSDEFTKLNWTAFFSYAVEEINSVVESAENQKEAIAEMFERSGDLGTEPIDTDLPTKRELLEDLKRITGSEFEPVGRDELGDPIPPDGVAPEDKWEYKQIWADFETIQNFSIDREPGIVDGPDDIEGRLGRDIRKMKRVASRIQQIEQELREASIKEIANMPEVQKKIRMIKQFAGGVLVGGTEEQNLEETATSIVNAAEQYSIDLSGGVKTTEESVTEPIDEVQEAVESEEAEPGEATDVEEMFGSDPQQ